MDCKVCLKENKIKVTKGRIAVLDILSNSEQAMSADDMYKQLKSMGNNIDLSTVYRNLELFVEKSIIDKFDTGDGKYNYKIEEHKHKHVIECSCCHKEIEIECPMIPVEEFIKNKTDFVLLEHELKIKALCKKCLKKRELKSKK